MSLTDWLFRTCWFSHAPDPIKVVRGKVLSWECRTCQADLGPVLAGQVRKYRKPRKAKTPPLLKGAKIIHGGGRFT